MIQTESRKPGSFGSMYDEAVQEFRIFQGYASDVLQSCNDDNNPSAIKVNFDLADEHYKKTGSFTRHLILWFTAKVGGKQPNDWTPAEQEQNALIRSLQGMLSSSMYHLLAAYRPWIAKAQFVSEADT